MRMYSFTYTTPAYLLKLYCDCATLFAWYIHRGFHPIFLPAPTSPPRPPRPTPGAQEGTTRVRRARRLASARLSSFSIALSAS